MGTRFIFNPLTGEFDLVNNPRSPLVDDATNSETGPISALKAVYYTGENSVGLADNSIQAKSYVAGISKNTAVSGENVQVVTKGTLSDPSWSWIPGEPLFVDTLGNITQTVTSGFRVQIGNAINSNTINIDITEPICLA